METPALPTSTGLRVSGDGLAPALGPYVREIYEERTEAPADGLVVALSARVDSFLYVLFSDGPTVHLAALGIAPFRIPASTISGPLADAYDLAVEGVDHGFYVRFSTVEPLARLGVRSYGLTARGAPALVERVTCASRAACGKRRCARRQTSSPRPTWDAMSRSMIYAWAHTRSANEVAEAMGRRICRVALKPLFLMLHGRPSCRRPFLHAPTRCAGLSPCSLC